MVHNSGASKRYGFNVGFPSGSPSITQAWAPNGKEFEMAFPILDGSGSPSTITSPVLGQVYSIKTRDQDMDIVSMEIFYSKENPVSVQ